MSWNTTDLIWIQIYIWVIGYLSFREQLWVVSFVTNTKVFDEHQKCIKFKVFTYHIKPLLKLAWIYPNNDFSSYRECDEEYLKGVLASFTPSSLMPVWLTDQMDSVTSLLQITDWGKYGRSIYQHIIGRKRIKRWLWRSVRRYPSVSLPTALYHMEHKYATLRRACHWQPNHLKDQPNLCP